MKLKRERTMPAHAHWRWKAFDNNKGWRFGSGHNCTCGYGLQFIIIPIIGTGSHNKTLYRCPNCTKNFTTSTRSKHSYILTTEGWKRNDI